MVVVIAGQKVCYPFVGGEGDTAPAEIPAPSQPEAVLLDGRTITARGSTIVPGSQFHHGLSSAAFLEVLFKA